MRKVASLSGSNGLIVLVLVLIGSKTFLPTPWNLYVPLSIVAAFLTSMLLDESKRKNIESKIRKRGLPANGKILSVREDGRDGRTHLPFISLALEVTAPGRGTWKAKTRYKAYSHFEMYQLQPGNTVNVMYDPGNIEEVIVSFGDANGENR